MRHEEIVDAEFRDDLGQEVPQRGKAFDAVEGSDEFPDAEEGMIGFIGGNENGAPLRSTPIKLTGEILLRTESLGPRRLARPFLKR